MMNIENLKERQKQAKIRSYNRSIANQQDKPQNRLRMALRTIRFSNRSGSHINCIRINSNNSIEHESMKFNICYHLSKNNHNFMTEAIFNEQIGIADIIDLNSLVIYEIVNTESKQSLKDKVNKYPDIFEVIPLKAEEVLKEAFTL